jgi:hypothetical protein
MSPDHLIEYWSVLDGQTQTVHPDDQAVLPQGQFAIDLQPLPWNGPLRSACAYILLLNPGLKPTDHEYEQRPEFREALRFNLTGNSPYLYLQSRFADRPGNDWARLLFGWDIGDAHADKICVIQLVPYHSQDGGPANRVAQHLHSSKKSIRFVHDWLVPRAKAGEIGLILLARQNYGGSPRGRVSVHHCLQRGRVPGCISDSEHARRKAASSVNFKLRHYQSSSAVAIWAKLRQSSHF